MFNKTNTRCLDKFRAKTLFYENFNLAKNSYIMKNPCIVKR